MQTTIKEFAAKHNISESAARARLEKLVREGKATKRVYDEMAYRRTRGYSGAYMPVKVATYTLTIDE